MPNKRNRLKTLTPLSTPWPTLSNNLLKSHQPPPQIISPGDVQVSSQLGNTKNKYVQCLGSMGDCHQRATLCLPSEPVLEIKARDARQINTSQEYQIHSTCNHREDGKHSTICWPWEVQCMAVGDDCESRSINVLAILVEG